jgi:hypothetical protein
MAGRPKSNDPLLKVEARLPQSQKEYLALWSKEEGTALRDIVERCQKMWPNGPFTAGGGKKKAGRPIVTPSLKAYAEAQGVEPKEAAAQIVADFLKKQQTE